MVYQTEVTMNREFPFPKRFNGEHFSSENFPHIVGLCERRDESYTTIKGNESYDYCLGEELIFRLTKNADRSFSMQEFDNGKEVVWSFGKNLGITLFHGLQNDWKRDGFTQMTLAVPQTEVANIKALMYYLGGYPGSKAGQSEKDVFASYPQFAHAEILSYRKIPVLYYPFLLSLIQERF
jgi:hypothetical protein